MDSTSGDDRALPPQNTINASAAERSVIVTGNRIDSRDLFFSDCELIIAHGESDYRLRLTLLNKLILTK